MGKRKFCTKIGFDAPGTGRDREKGGMSRWEIDDVEKISCDISRSHSFRFSPSWVALACTAVL